MEALLPLVIMIVLSIVLGSRKKKRPDIPPVDYGEPTASESPWDDLMRELSNARDRGRTPEEIYGLPDPEEKEVAGEPVFRMKPPASASFPDPLPVSESVYSYDDVSLEENTFSYENYEEYIPEETTAHAQAVSSIAPPEKDPPTLPAADVEDEGAFVGGFDPRMAVLYSEVFRPKYPGR